MAGILRIVGWLAVAVGVIFVILPMFTSTGLSTDTMVSSGIYLIIAGPLLIGLAKLIEVTEKIQANTNWLSSRGTPAAQSATAQSAAAHAAAAAQEAEEVVETVEKVVEPEPKPVPAPPPVPAPEPVAEKVPEPPVEQRPAPTPSAAVQSASRVIPAAPELYDASKHPAAVDEWSQNGRRIMTLEDGSYASEVDGAWYRFLDLKDIELLP